jgi:hypothetical protein
MASATWKRKALVLLPTTCTGCTTSEVAKELITSAVLKQLCKRQAHCTDCKPHTRRTLVFDNPAYVVGAFAHCRRVRRKAKKTKAKTKKTKQSKGKEKLEEMTEWIAGFCVPSTGIGGKTVWVSYTGHCSLGLCTDGGPLCDLCAAGATSGTSATSAAAAGTSVIAHVISLSSIPTTIFLQVNRATGKTFVPKRRWGCRGYRWCRWCR